ncbi:MAG: alpha/beta hydrolase [Mycobacterium sp.]|nr:alpha/beta hydrolase [Mycobacterium sp.]
MVLAVDPEVLAGMRTLPAAAGDPPAVGDVATRRANTATLFAHLAAARAAVPGVRRTDHTLTTPDGAVLALSWYRRDSGEPPGSAVLYLHGGGMIVGLLPIYDSAARSYVAATGVPMLVVDYRIAPEYPHPTPVQDCYSALLWLAEHSTHLGVDPARIAVMGDSAGGGLAAGVALLARDRGGPALAQQLLIYPMLDDRTTTPDPQFPPVLTWNYDDNMTGWTALLGADAGGPEVSMYAAPARAVDLAGLPATYIDVGEVDIFREENIDYARRLSLAGVPTELHVHPGCPHAFEAVAPDAAVSQRVFADRLRRIASL